MQLLAHRGIWNRSEEKNSLQAILAAFKLGVGIETDIRDCDGSLVISHDPPRSDGALTLDDVLQLYTSGSVQPVLGLNIKSDGIQEALLDSLQRHSVRNYFVFDMSVPDTLQYRRLQMPFAARISEYEPHNVLGEDAQWIWLDAFHSDWFDLETIQRWLEQEKCVAVVSSELHGRSHLPLWNTLRPLSGHPKLYLCTDLINESKDFFHVEES